jgi:hypothetical protein
MNKKCSICGKREFPILRQKRCVGCIARLNEEVYFRLNKNKRPKFSADLLLTEYVLNHSSLTELAKNYNVSKPALIYWFKYYEIPLRTISQGLKKKIDSEFFSDLNPDSAFLLGYIFTDGDLQLNKKTNRHFLRLYGKYQNDLVLALNLLKSTAKIQQRKAVMTESIRQAKVYFIHVADETLIGDLMDLGMVRNKNSKIKFPNITEDLNNHFIRGCWAGSGHVYVDKNAKINSGIVLASIDLIQKIETILNGQGLKKRKIFEHKHTKTKSYYFRYSQRDTKLLYHYLYKGATYKNTINHQSQVFVDFFKNK